MDQLAARLRLSILLNEMKDIAEELPGPEGRIVRSSAKMLALVKSGTFEVMERGRAENENGALTVVPPPEAD